MYTGYTYHRLGNLLYTKDSLRASIDNLREAVEILREGQGTSLGAAARSKFHLARTPQDLGNFEESNQLYKERDADLLQCGYAVEARQLHPGIWSSLCYFVIGERIVSS
ncbi:uncharacterized protein K489DRAFT_97163 [Dissoconium aciculare CBS 342.82]|uniref:TPR-like protein n=1 Tax=Dissoconium aciculare CBS 342.82 TaxID=1314786 RepID=A0A6J3LRB8_9PEZI|nr:uncharacterized protein K489DRAFT_97163 [Dissoconium aciculare CBS 342.82]KAF1818380.1 hypothetical protein K489DRAFT_97163 [Dissoconium aciculare CBS 342.82]